MRSILRPKAVHRPGNLISVGATKFYADYVLHDESDPFVPGTAIPRLRSVPLGARAIGFFDDEVAALQEALRQLRDATPLKISRTAKRKRDADCKRNEQEKLNVQATV
jgi:hypothetical protein